MFQLLEEHWVNMQSLLHASSRYLKKILNVSCENPLHFTQHFRNCCFLKDIMFIILMKYVVHQPIMLKQDRRSIDAIVIKLQWLLKTLLLQNVKPKSNMNEIMDVYLNVQILKFLNI